MSHDPHARAVAAYHRGLENLPKIDQLVLLYDAALARVREAEAACREGRIEARFQASLKATAILEGLQGALDREAGGEIAGNLERIYTYLMLRLQEANVRSEPAIFAEVAERLAELRSAWAALADRPAHAEAGSLRSEDTSGAGAAILA